MSKKTRTHGRRITRPCWICGQWIPDDYPWSICADCCSEPGSIKHVGRKA